MPVSASVSMILSAKDQASSVLKTVEQRIQSLEGAVARARATMNAFSAGFGKIALAAGAMTGALAAGIGFLTKMNVSIEDHLRTAQTMFDITEQGWQEMEKQIEETALKTGRSLNDLADAMYLIGSAGIPAEKALTVLRQTAVAATAGATDMQTALSSGISIINAYGLQIEDLSRVYALQFETVRKGLMTYEQLATDFGVVAPAARQLGASLEEALSGYAALTKMGISSAEAATATARAFLDLVSKGDKLAKIGVKIYDEYGRFRGILPIIRDLRENLKGTQEEQAQLLEQIGFEVRAARAVVNWAAGYETLRDTVQSLQGDTQALLEAFDKQTRSIGFLWRMMVSGLQVLGRSLWGAIGPFVRDLLWKFIQGIAALKKFIDENSVTVRMFVEGLLKLGAVVFAVSTGLSLIFKFASGFFYIIQLGLTFLKPLNILLVALGVAIWQVFRSLDRDKQQKILNFFRSIWEGIKNFVSGLIEAAASDKPFQGVKEFLRNQFANIWNWIKDVAGTSLEAIIKIFPVLGWMWQGIQYTWEQFKNVLSQYISKDWQELKEAWEKGDIWGVIKALFKVAAHFVWAGIVAFGRAISRGIDLLADAARKSLGLPEDKNATLDWGDIVVIFKFLASITWKALKFLGRTIGAGIDYIADAVRRFLGLPEDENKALDWGDIVVIAKFVLNIVSAALRWAGQAIDNLADKAREVLGLPKDENDQLDWGDIFVIARLIINITKKVLTWTGQQVDQLADLVRKALGLPEDENSSFDLGDIEVIGRLVGRLIVKAFEFMGKAFTSLVDALKEHLGLDQALDLGTIQAVFNIVLIPFKIAWAFGWGVGEEIGKALAETNIGKALSERLSQTLQRLAPEELEKLNKLLGSPEILDQLKGLGLLMAYNLREAMEAVFVELPLKFVKWVSEGLEKFGGQLLEIGKKIGNALLEGIKYIFTGQWLIDLIKGKTQEAERYFQGGLVAEGGGGGFQAGGFTGFGALSEIAGVVHRGEYVIPAWMVKRYPEIVAELERIRRRGFQAGGATTPVSNMSLGEALKVIGEALVGNQDLLQGLQQTGEDTVKALAYIIQRLPDFLKEYNEDPQKAIQDLLKDFAGSSKQTAQAQLTEQKKQTGILAKLQEAWKNLKTLFPELTFYEQIPAFFGAIGQGAADLVDGAVKVFKYSKSVFEQTGDIWETIQFAFAAGKVQLKNLLTNFSSAIVAIFSAIGASVLSAFAQILGTSEALQKVLSPITTILEAMMEVLNPVLDELLTPLVGILKVIGITLGKMLVPVLKMLSPVILLLANAFIFLYNKAIVPIANTLIDIAVTIYNAIAKVWNWIADVINTTLGWAGVHITKMEEMDAAAMKLKEIDMADIVYGMGEEAAAAVGELAVKEKESEGRLYGAPTASEAGYSIPTAGEAGYTAPTAPARQIIFQPVLKFEKTWIGDKKILTDAVLDAFNEIRRRTGLATGGVLP